MKGFQKKIQKEGIKNRIIIELICCIFLAGDALTPPNPVRIIKREKIERGLPTTALCPQFDSIRVRSARAGQESIK